MSVLIFQYKSKAKRPEIKSIFSKLKNISANTFAFEMNEAKIHQAWLQKVFASDPIHAKAEEQEVCWEGQVALS